MKQKLLFALTALAALALGTPVYFAFHPSRGFVSHSPTTRVWAVDCKVGGFTDLTYHFRAHDLRVSFFEPLLIADLFWKGKYTPGGLFWSRDGTVAAASVVYDDNRGEAFAGAYNFREHRIVHADLTGSPLNDSKQDEIRHLLESRGGYNRVELPDYKDL